MHMIYCSTASHAFSDDELDALLEKARLNNLSLNVTGMLLYENGSFFQVIEGAPDVIEKLFRKIGSDSKHHKVITIISEPIAKRSFADWTMGYVKLSKSDISDLIGSNDFFTHGNSLNQLDPTRAKKLLSAFKKGRWRARIESEPKLRTKVKLQNAPLLAREVSVVLADVSSAFQTIIDANSRQVFAYEALPRNANGDVYLHKANRDDNFQSTGSGQDFWISALKIANKLNNQYPLIFRLKAEAVGNAHSAISAMVIVAKQLGVSPSSIVLKVNQDNLIGEPDMFARMIQEFRAAGLKLAIDEFGSGRSSLNLLETYQPDYIFLNSSLVSNIHANGSRQAIVRGVQQTCLDLGIDIIANHVASFAEFEWFYHEGISLFQGPLISEPEFEKLPIGIFPVLE